MENIMVAIVTDDKEYGRSLSLGMLNVCRSFIIRIFSAEEFLKENKTFDVVLWDGEEVREAYGGRIVYLAEKPSEAVRNIMDKRFCIYKYSTAACMVASIFEIYELLTGRRAVNLKRQDVRLFAFSSYEGGVGCTTLALATAQELSRFFGKKVFYISFEEVESTGEYFASSPGMKGAAVYLYELFSRSYGGTYMSNSYSENVPFLEGKVIRDDYEVEAFAASAGRNPMMEVTPDELDKVISSIIDSGRYDVVIMDLGQYLSKTGLKCISMAERLCLVSQEGRMGVKESQYICHVMSNCGEDTMNKIIMLKNMCEKNEETEGKSAKQDVDEHIKIRKSNSFAKEDGRIRIVLEGGFGEDINRLAGIITEPL